MNIELVGIALEDLKSDGFHHHNNWEIILNITGEGTAIVDNKEYEFFPGTIMCIPPKVVHTKYSDKRFKDIFIRLDKLSILKNNSIPVFMDDEEQSIRKLMFMALRIFHKKGKNHEAATDAVGEAIQQLLLGQSGENQRNESVELFKNELIKNFTDPEFKLSHALKNTNYSADHFRRCFKASTGETPVSYLINLRIEYAKNLLKQKNATLVTISEIALNSGFYDSRYFSRIFKKITGLTPHNYADKQQSF